MVIIFIAIGTYIPNFRPWSLNWVWWPSWLSSVEAYFACTVNTDEQQRCRWKCCCASAWTAIFLTTARAGSNDWSSRAREDILKTRKASIATRTSRPLNLPSSCSQIIAWATVTNIFGQTSTLWRHWPLRGNFRRERKRVASGGSDRQYSEILQR